MRTRFLLLGLSFVMAAFQSSLVAASKKVLVVSVTTEFRHVSIETGEKVLSQLAQESGAFTLEFVRQPPGFPKAPAKPKPGSAGVDDPAHQEALRAYEQQMKVYEEARKRWMPSAAEALKALSPDRLRGIDAVLFLSTTGDLPVPDLPGLMKWISDGHAFIGIHAASDTFHSYPLFYEMLGAEFSHHGPQVEVSCLVSDSSHPSTRPITAPWKIWEEIYLFKTALPTDTKVLITLDRHPNQNTPGSFPLAWCRHYGKGRVFYTALGHRRDVWDPTGGDESPRKNDASVAETFQKHLLGGIQWALTEVSAKQ